MKLKQVKSFDKSDEVLESKRNEGCYLYGAKFYCTKSRANESEILCEICQDSSDTDMLSVPKTKLGIMRSKSNEQDEWRGILQNMPHKDGIGSVECENSGNLFRIRVGKQSQHCFLKFYSKLKKIILAKDWNNMCFKQKGFKKSGISFASVLIDFLFDTMSNSDSNSCYLSLMESIDCLQVFKHYHQLKKKKKYKLSFDEILHDKLNKVDPKTPENWAKWAEVYFFTLPSCVFFFLFFLCKDVTGTVFCFCFVFVAIDVT